MIHAHTFERYQFIEKLQKKCLPWNWQQGISVLLQPFLIILAHGMMVQFAMFYIFLQLGNTFLTPWTYFFMEKGIHRWTLLLHASINNGIRIGGTCTHFVTHLPNRPMKGQWK